MKLLRLFGVLVVLAGIAIVLTIAPGRFGFAEGLNPAPASGMAQAGMVARSFGRLQDLGRHLPMALRTRRDEAGGGRRLGITVQDMTPELAKFFGVKGGVLVASVDSDSAAAAAGLAVGDVITRIAGQDVSGRWELSQLLERASAGDVSMGVVRAHKALTLTVRLQAVGPESGRGD